MNNTARLDAIALAVEGRLRARDDIDAVFLAGSVVEGFGNMTSDIDVLVMSPTGGSVTADWPGQRDEFTFRDCRIEIVYIEGERVDVETRSSATVRELIDRLRRIPLTQAGADQLNTHEWQFLHQLRIGRPVKGAGTLCALRDEIDWTALTRLLSIHREGEYSAHAEDAAGAIHADDVGTALLTSRFALATAMDCLIAAAGHSNTKDKWRYRKLYELRREELVQRCLGLECDAGSDAASILSSARRRLVAAQDLVAQAAELREKVAPR
jgi:predicted nucleotidyltransferase